METDPTRNVVVFQLGHDGNHRAAADAPTLDDDCVRQAWLTVQREHGARPEDVVALHSEWEPSSADAFFIERMFPRATVFYSFGRPDPDGWERALEDARRTMREVLRQREADELDTRRDAVERDGELLPVLWSATSPRAGLLEALPHRTVVPGRVYVALAVVGPTPTGTVGMSHVTHHVHGELGGQPFGELLAEAGATLAAGLRIDGYRWDGGEVLAMHRDGGPVAAAVALPDFHERMSGMIGARRLIVGLPCPQELVVGPADEPAHAELVEDMVFSSSYPDSELVPSVLLVEAGGIRLLAERSGA